jgi:hypothetical protein
LRDQNVLARQDDHYAECNLNLLWTFNTQTPEINAEIKLSEITKENLPLYLCIHTYIHFTHIFLIYHHICNLVRLILQLLCSIFLSSPVPGSQSYGLGLQQQLIFTTQLTAWRVFRIKKYFSLIEKRSSLLQRWRCSSKS